MSLLLDSKGNLFAGPKGGSNGGLFLFNRETKEYKRFLNDPLDPYSISYDNGYLRSMIEDNVGNIWFTQSEGKLNIINNQKKLFQYNRNYSRIKNDIQFSRETRIALQRSSKENDSISFV